MYHRGRRSQSIGNWVSSTGQQCDQPFSRSTEELECLQSSSIRAIATSPAHSKFAKEPCPYSDGGKPLSMSSIPGPVLSAKLTLTSTTRPRYVPSPCVGALLGATEGVAVGAGEATSRHGRQPACLDRQLCNGSAQQGDDMASPNENRTSGDLTCYRRYISQRQRQPTRPLSFAAVRHAIN